MVPCLEPVNHPTLYLRSILNVYEVLSHFICCGWAYGCTLTQLHLCRWGPNSKFWKIGAKGEPKKHHGVMFGGCKPKCLSLFICCGWAYGCTFTQLHLCRWGPNSKFWKFGAKGEPKYHHGVMLGGCKPPNSASYIHIACINSIQAPSYAVDGLY